MKELEEIGISFVINSLAERSKILEEELREIKSKRFFVSEVENALAKSGQRVILISGLRGTGKTTGMYQIFKEWPDENKAYFSCDELVSKGFSLEKIIEFLDYIQKEKIGLGKKFLLLLDEITYLKDWDLKLKILNDKRPHLFIIATSSSALPIRKTTELVRRSYEINVLPLSFREYLLLKYNLFIPLELSESIRKKIGKESLEDEYLKILSITGRYNLFALYEEYMTHDLPAALKLSEVAYTESVKKIIKRTIYEDFSKYERFETKMLNAAEVMINYISTVPADGVKISTLSEVVGVSKESIMNLLGTFENAMILKGIEYYGRNRMYKKPKKWFFYSSSMRSILASNVVDRSTIIGNCREDSVFRHLASFSKSIFYSHEIDFIADGLGIEIGGKAKKERSNALILGMDERITKNRMPIPLFALSV